MTTAAWVIARGRPPAMAYRVALGLLVATFGSLVVAAFAGARRTATVVDRAIAARAAARTQPRPSSLRSE